MSNVLVIADHNKISGGLVDALKQSSMVETCQVVAAHDPDLAGRFAETSVDTVVYSPQFLRPKSMAPNLAEAEMVFAACAKAGIRRMVVLSSAAIYAATPHNSGRIAESERAPRGYGNLIKEDWVQFEALIEKHLKPGSGTTANQNEMLVTILRPSIVLRPDGIDYFSRLFSGRFAFTLPFYDPSIQLLSPKDLAKAVRCAIEKGREGIFNVAPTHVIPLRTGLRMAHLKRIPMPAPLQRYAADQLEYIRHSWTVSGEKIERELGFVPEQSSAAALSEFLGIESSGTNQVFDDFGHDINHSETMFRWVYRFLHNTYWRVEVKGLGHVPRDGRAILVGVHRGFMPYDGTMMLYLIAREMGRYVRTLIHPALVKTPIPFNFLKLGGINACQENADHVLQREELLMWFPEGITGAFRYYRGVYKLGKFGRDEYVRAALRNQAPIIPFVTVGSAEIFPIIAKIDWKGWKRESLWPCFPIAPPWPLLPMPLPSKWHTQFLAPIHLGKKYPPEAADDPATVKAIGQEIKAQMQQAIDEMLKRRKSIWFGSIFTDEEDDGVA